MATLESLLARIAEGKTSFAPAGKSDSDIEAFQETAKILEYAHAQGLLDGYASHKESYTGHRWYVLVMVRNGLSYDGQKRLHPSSAVRPEPKGEVVQLKPNIYGVGIDLKALWRKIRR